MVILSYQLMFSKQKGVLMNLHLCVNSLPDVLHHHLCVLSGEKFVKVVVIL